MGPDDFVPEDMDHLVVLLGSDLMDSIILLEVSRRGLTLASQELADGEGSVNRQVRSPDGSSLIADWSDGNLSELTSSPSGRYWIRLGSDWAINFFARWEHFYRPYARRFGCGDFDVMGDLRRIRHDILHCRGVATQDNCGRNQILDWFKPGDKIIITSMHTARFWEAMDMSQLVKKATVRVPMRTPLQS